MIKIFSNKKMIALLSFTIKEQIPKPNRINIIELFFVIVCAMVVWY